MANKIPQAFFDKDCGMILCPIGMTTKGGAKMIIPKNLEGLVALALQDVIAAHDVEEYGPTGVPLGSKSEMKALGKFTKALSKKAGLRYR